MFTPQMDGNGRYLLYCHYCLMAEAQKPNQAIVVSQGYSLCQPHFEQFVER